MSPASLTEDQQIAIKEQSGTIDTFAQHLGASHHAKRDPGKSPTLLEFFDAYRSLIERSVSYFRNLSESQLNVTYAAEWLLDNHYIIQQVLTEIKQDLPVGFYKQLPKLESGLFSGYPRVYAIASELLLFERFQIDSDRVRQFIHSYQVERTLTMGELWALPIMLRLGIIQALSQALLCLTDLGPEVEYNDLLLLEYDEKIKDEEVVANGIVSLRALDAEDWKEFFESLSAVEHILSNDPARIYPGMDFKTRDRYRKVVENYYLSGEIEETEVAQQAVRLAQQAIDQHRQATRPVPGLAKYATRAGEDSPYWDHFKSRREEHIGYYLVGEGQPQLEEVLGYRPSPGERLKRLLLQHPTPLYLGSISLVGMLILVVVSAFMLIVGGNWLSVAGTWALFLILALSASVTLVNWVSNNLLVPRTCSKMDFEAGIPGDAAAIIVVPTLFTDQKEVHSLLGQLEQHYLRNREDHLFFALLSDFSDAPQEETSEDKEIIETALEGIRTLNERYRRENESIFSLFHRRRQWNSKEKTWMGWERKRGKLHEFNQLLAGAENTSFLIQEGDLPALRKARYVITLDADTILPPGAASQLVATMAHPLNRAVFDSHNRIVAGYTVLQPRPEIHPRSANRSLFSRIFSGDTGLDLYTLAVSDVYQDLFGEGIFVGKGIYDIRAMERSLIGRVPENALLSHDLFEGIHGRSGLVTDIVLIEDYPSTYLASTNRQHRWMRGDWQLLPWLMPQVPGADGRKLPNSLTVIDRWKILDNLRRSLLAPASLLALISGWLFLPGSALVWTLIVLLLIAAPHLTALLDALLGFLEGASFSRTLQQVRESLARFGLSVLFLPYDTLVALDAISTTLWRLFYRKVGMLEWTTSAQSARLYGEVNGRLPTWMRMLPAVIVGLAVLALVISFSSESLFAAIPLILAWLAAPEIAYQLSRPLIFAPPKLEEDEIRELRRLGRQTWVFFEQFVGPEDHWLPPDHFQETPRGIVAHRTSPTNIGLALLSALGASDLGYITVLELVARLQATFDSLGKLERFRGHFLNWYDTRSLSPLPPRYVSTVDSGNLAGCLISLSQGCSALPDQPILRWETWQGLLDALDLLSTTLKKLEVKNGQAEVETLVDFLSQLEAEILAEQGKLNTWFSLLDRLAGNGIQRLDHLLVAVAEAVTGEVPPEHLRQVRIYSQRIRHHIEAVQREVEVLNSWLEFFSSYSDDVEQMNRSDREIWFALQQALPPSIPLADIPQAAASCIQLIDEGTSESTLVRWDELKEMLGSAGMAAKALLIGLQDLRFKAREYVSGMEFGFLFDRKREVFHIGYNLELSQPDANYYDLLASEARIASLIGIAKGDVPRSHWLHLSRPLTRIGGQRALLSWSATMFEYLMPDLLLQSYEGTLLHHTSRVVVDEQIRYAHHRDAPWGISESGYYRFDNNQNYQYRAFGVPGLGFKRGLGEDLVIAPYAAMLALPYRPKAVVENLHDFQAIQMMGVYGLYEAVDFTPTRLPVGRRYARIQSYMAHHQGMILLTLVNYLQDEIMIRRFQADPYIHSVELLLQEQVPQSAPIEEPHAEETRRAATQLPEVITQPWPVHVHTPQPRVHTLSNGRYSVMITNTGGGYSLCEGIELTRWRPDTTLDNWGTWFYIQDLDQGGVWSAGFQPVGTVPQTWDIYFSAHLAEFRRMDGDISTITVIGVPPEDNLEIRQVTLTNHSGEVRRLQVTSYAEVGLNTAGSDLRHPAFSKLFVESEYIPEVNGLFFQRRPRKESEERLWMAHALILEPGMAPSRIYETDRLKFLGRGRTARYPSAIFDPSGLTHRTGATLDPVMALGQVVELQPHASVHLTYITLSAASKENGLEMIARYRAQPAIRKALDLASSQSEMELRRLGLNTIELERLQKLLSLLLYPHPFLRAPADIIASNRLGQPGLWPYGISGDYPVLLLLIHGVEELPLLQDLLKAHRYWRDRQLKIDLVILNQQGTDYGQELTGQIQRLLQRMESDVWLNQRGGIFLLHRDRLSESDRILLETFARVILDAQKGSLDDQLEGMDRLPPRLPRFETEAGALQEPIQPVQRPGNLQFDNGYGGFLPDGKEYQIYLEPRQWTPAPWTNVIANPDFGFITTEAGGGFTWAINSGENRLTPWSNDPVSDHPGEVLYLRDEETAQVWSATPLPAGGEASYLVRHGAGYTIYEHNRYGLEMAVRMFVSPEDPVKLIHLQIQNTSDRFRRITATYYVEWVLGVLRSTARPFIIPEYIPDPQALLAYNPYNAEFGERVAFTAASQPLHGLTADRTEFLGRTGSLESPAALQRVGLSGTVQAGSDPCAALQVHLDIPPGERREVVFLLGQGDNREHSLALIRSYQAPEAVVQSWKASYQQWEEILDAVQVDTPEPALNLMLNRWLLYQALSCRIWGRSAFYQSSGAYGFRDQLQDVMSLVFSRPTIAREQILRAARHQFEAGDVLHWWHPPSGRGVRTRITDDLLWLPFVTAHYVEATGDWGILDEKVPFLRGQLLEPEEEERYGQYESTQESYSIFEHCRRALERGSTSGSHGLPLMGAGDWNDGMNRVGIEGRGESVWLGWFLNATLQRFAWICERSNEQALASMYRERAEKLKENLDAHAWDGAWYRRAYYDDGFPLGSKENRECQIDAIAQSWSILSGAGDAERSRQAMRSVQERLVRPDDSLVLLFTPPFDKTPRDPGYIKGYLPGIRENGGQYTHAATWTVWAFAEIGMEDFANALYHLLNPVNDTDTPDKVERYRVEPYVIAADVYSVPPHVGRGGWTWYTGSASWMYRLGLEQLLGFRLVGEGFTIDPHIPSHWPGFSLVYRRNGALYRIQVENPDGVSHGVRRLSLNGTRLDGSMIPFQADGDEYQILVELG